MWWCVCSWHQMHLRQTGGGPSTASRTCPLKPLCFMYLDWRRCRTYLNLNISGTDTSHIMSILRRFRYILWAGSSNIMQTSRVYVFEIGRRCLTYLNLNMSGSDTSYIISILGRSWWFLWAGENRSSSLHAILNPVLWRPSQWSIKYLKTHISPSVFWAWISRELIHFSSEIPDNCENSVCRSLFEGLGHHTSTLFLPCPKMFFVVCSHACQVQYFPKTRPVPQNHRDPELQMGHQCEGQSFPARQTALSRWWGSQRWRGSWNLTWCMTCHNLSYLNLNKSGRRRPT